MILSATAATYKEKFLADERERERERPEEGRNKTKCVALATSELANL